MSDLFDNPVGLCGFEFVEFAHPDPQKLRDTSDNRQNPMGWVGL